MQSPIPKALGSCDQQQPGEGENEDGEIQEDYVDTRPAASEIAAVEQEIEDLYAGDDGDDGASTRGRANTMENKFKKMITSGPRVPAMRMRRTSSAKASSEVRNELFTVSRPLLMSMHG